MLTGERDSDTSHDTDHDVKFHRWIIEPQPCHNAEAYTHYSGGQGRFQGGGQDHGQMQKGDGSSKSRHLHKT